MPTMTKRYLDVYGCSAWSKVVTVLHDGKQYQFNFIHEAREFAYSKGYSGIRCTVSSYSGKK